MERFNLEKCLRKMTTNKKEKREEEIAVQSLLDKFGEFEEYFFLLNKGEIKRFNICKEILKNSENEILIHNSYKYLLSSYPIFEERVSKKLDEDFKKIIRGENND